MRGTAHPSSQIRMFDSTMCGVPYSAHGVGDFQFILRGWRGLESGGI